MQLPSGAVPAHTAASRRGINLHLRAAGLRFVSSGDGAFLQGLSRPYSRFAAGARMLLRQGTSAAVDGLHTPTASLPTENRSIDNW